MAVPHGRSSWSLGTWMRNHRSLHLLPIAGVSCLLGACGKPVVTNSSDASSPSARWVATLELVDNGVGFGQGLLYEEVHLSRTDARRFLWRHGEPDPSVVSYAASLCHDGRRAKVTWPDSSHLTIQYPDCADPGRMLPRFEDVVVTYHVASQIPAHGLSAQVPNYRLERP
jgi:hypothetical protein